MILLPSGKSVPANTVPPASLIRAKVRCCRQAAVEHVGSGAGGAWHVGTFQLAKTFSRWSVPGQTCSDSKSKPPLVVMMPRCEYTAGMSAYDWAALSVTVRG